jgi:hypothetical protein
VDFHGSRPVTDWPKIRQDLVACFYIYDMIKLAATDYSKFDQALPMHAGAADSAPAMFPPQITYFEAGEKL